MKTINSFRSKLLALTLALMASVSSFAYDYHGDLLCYNVLTDSTVAVTGQSEYKTMPRYEYLPENLAIPAEVTLQGKAYKVVSIDQWAFYACTMLKSVTIPSSVTFIGKSAFHYCENLVYVDIPTSVTTVEGSAFSYTKWYDNLPDGEVYINNTLYRYKGTAPENTQIVVKDGTTRIAGYTFWNQSNIVSIELPQTLTVIEHDVFEGCTQLSSILIPKNVTDIGASAFADCTGLTEVICLAPTPPTMGQYANPSADSEIFARVDVSNTTLYVPAESVEAYKNVDQWKDFGQILPIEPTTSYKSQWCDTWNMLVRTSSIYPPSPYRYQLAKDTVIGEHTYTAVVQKVINDALMHLGTWYVAAVRFTDDRKVYIYYDNAEYLLYDFNVQQGDELEVFAGINNYTSEIKTYKCTVTGVEQYACVGCPAAITLEVHNHPNDFREFYRETQWIEGVGDINGFLNGINHYVEMDGGGSEYLLCAYQGDELKYTGDLYEEYGCGDDAEQSPEDLFPTLWGLQRTHTIEMYDYAPNDGKRSGGYPLPFASVKDTVINGKTYLQFGDYVNGSNYSLFFLREENNKVLIYSSILQNDLVLYDYTLELGDSLPAITSDHDYFSDDHFTKLDKAEDIFTYVVTDVSTVTLLDGIERKKWILKNKYLPIIEYVEGIGCYGENTSHSGDFFRLIHDHPYTTEYVGDHLVCVSKNGQLLYKMDDTEMEQLETECLCEIEPKWSETWCNKWNVMWFDGMRFDETARTSKYRLGKDTVIGDYTYSKFIPGTYVRFTDDRKVYVYHEYFDDHDPYSEDLPTGEYLAYDFSAQVGDTLEVFSGIGTYSTYPCVVDDVQIDSETNLRTMTLHKICRIDEDEYDDSGMTWIEGVGSPEGFLISYLPCGWAGGGTYALLCAYQGDELKYTGSLYEHFGCDYKAGVVSDDLFPTLSGLQRTICREYCEQADNKTRIEQFTNLTTRTETGGPYLYYSPFLLREKDNKILIYSRTLNKDLVLYDFNLQVGDSLPMLYIDFFAKDDWIADRDMEIWCVVDYHKDLEGNILPADTLIVTDVSAITLLDGKEYKKWTFNNGMEYVEGIGSFGNRQWSGDFFQLIANRDVPTSLQGEHLVCISKNGQLLYQMDDAEMERLGAECLCEYTAELTPEDLFPTLWGLQRTDVELHTTGDNELYRSTFNEYIHFVPSKKQRIYLTYDRQTYLREENNQVLLYAPSYGINEDIVLYDWTLEKNDTLQVGLYDEIERGKLFRVTDVSTVTLLDGKEYKKWTLACGIEYIEGIGAINGEGFGNYLCLQHKGHPATYIGSPLVCASRNGKLLYQMDDAEMERLGVECLCEYNSGPKKDNAKNGKIGGRPTPTQWNMLEFETKEVDGTPTITRAETFSYTLENDSIVTKGKTFYQLARQSTKDTAITKSFVGALHFGEDEDNRVYFLRDGVEYVLYDFTAEPGDTIEIFAGINNYPQYTTYTHVVTGKDTLENGACRMILEVVFPEEIGSDLEQQHLQKVWLAGLGSIDGIVHNAASRATKARSSETQTSVMLCAWRDDNCLYTTDHPDYDSYGCVYNLPASIKDIETPGGKCQKIIRNGHLYILRENKLYDVLGTPMIMSWE